MTTNSHQTQKDHKL